MAACTEQNLPWDNSQEVYYGYNTFDYNYSGSGGYGGYGGYDSYGGYDNTWPSTCHWNQSSRERTNSRRRNKDEGKKSAGCRQSKSRSCKPPPILASGEKAEDPVKTPKERAPTEVPAEAPAAAEGLEKDCTFAPSDLDPKALCSSLVAVYRSLVAMAKQKGEEQRLTRFHSKIEPVLGVEPYMERIWQYFNCSDSCHVMALVYIDRIVKMNPEFVVSSLTIHRLLAVATLISAKFMDDVYFSNAYYAKVCGMTLQELNRLEACFLSMIRWKLSVPDAEYAAYLAQVLRASGK